MPKKTFTTEQIISKLREGEILLSQGQTVSVVCKRLGIVDQTYNWLAPPICTPSNGQVATFR